MENHGILGWRRWSIMRKAQVIGAAIGAILTVVVPLLMDFSETLGMSREATMWLLQAYIVLTLAPEYLLGLVGILQAPQGQSAWALQIVINAFVCMLIGTLVGCLLRSFTRANH